MKNRIYITSEMIPEARLAEHYTEMMPVNRCEVSIKSPNSRFFEKTAI